MLSKVTEKEIVQIWQRQLLERTSLMTEEGEPIAIIHPGRLNDDQGPDFREAVMTTSRGLLRGDIEIHVKSRDWQAHRHHQDPLYNGVILHVVMWHNVKGMTHLQNGRAVPILALSKYLKLPVGQWANLVASPVALDLPCFKVEWRLNRETIISIFDSAGGKRFSLKAARFQRDLAQMEARQVLYQGIMSALGYAKNKLQFLELARSLPLETLESITEGDIMEENYVARRQALLLGRAGLLLSQRPEQYQERARKDDGVDKLEKVWAAFSQTNAMSYQNWRLFKVRPNNSPRRRLVAMSHLLFRYRRQGMFDGLVSLVSEAPVSRGHRQLEEGLVVGTNGATLLGRERAAEIIVNVLLPFVFAWSQFSAQTTLGRKALELYRAYPRLALNAVEKQMMTQLGLSKGLVNSAQRQQGLIHLYKSLCTQGWCHCCPFRG